MVAQRWLYRDHDYREQEVSKMWFLFKALCRHARFAPVERALLQALQARLSEEPRAILARQIEAVNYIYRDKEGGEVNLYTSKKKPLPRFPNQRLEALWCTIYYRVPSETDLLKARLYLVRGKLFTLAFGRTYRKIASQNEVHIERIVFHADVMQPVAESPPLPVREEGEAPLLERLPSWCTELGRRWAIEQVLPPLSPEERQPRLQAIEAALPKDYLDLVEVCEGFRIADAVVWGLSDIREVYLPSGAYYLMAERGGGYLGVLDGQQDGRVYYLHHEHLEPLARFVTFAEALEYLLTRPDLP
jgi:hypothetical protein